mgnify:CR=1 FL=1
MAVDGVERLPCTSVARFFLKLKIGLFRWRNASIEDTMQQQSVPQNVRQHARPFLLLQISLYSSDAANMDKVMILQQPRLRARVREWPSKLANTEKSIYAASTSANHKRADHSYSQDILEVSFKPTPKSIPKGKKKPELNISSVAVAIPRSSPFFWN